MSLRRSPLALFFVVLLAPTVFVGWLGLRQIRIYEGQRENSLAREAESVLRGAEQRFTHLLETLLESSRLTLWGRERNEIRRAVERLPRENSAVTSSFLLDREGTPILPKLLEDGGWTLPTPASIVASLPLVEQSRALVARTCVWLEEAGSQASMQLQEDALRTLGAIDVQKLPAALAAYVCLRRGHLHAQTHSHEQALVEFDVGLAAIEDLVDDENVVPLRLSLLLAEAESELADAAAAQGEPRRMERAQSVLTRILRDVAGGSYDEADEALLDGVWQKARRLADRLAATRPAFGQELEGLDVRNLERKGRRHSLQQIFEHSPLRERVRQTREPERYPITLPFAGTMERKETSLVAVLHVEDETGEVLLPGIKIDLEILLAEPLLDLEARLAEQGRYEVALLDENNERLGEFVRRSQDLSEEDRELRARLTTPLRLGPPLLGFSLAATPRDPAAVLSEATRALVTRGVLLLALAVVAGAGAFLLLRSMRREAELARLKTSFVGRVSHELKTPLALIKMYGETLALGRAREPERVRHFASIIARESDRLTGMIDNVLDFSRIEAGRKSYDRRHVELDVLLLEIVESYRSHLEEAGFEVLTHVEAGIEAELDPSAFTQAIVNLLGNARKYTDDSGLKEIDVHLRRAGPIAELSVLDRGIGVPEGERDRVFETFYRASTAGERRGAGLGLALIRHFVEAHGGEALCLPRDGGGSVFVLRLPVLPSKAPAEPTASAS